LENGQRTFRDWVDMDSTGAEIAGGLFASPAASLGWQVNQKTNGFDNKLT
jgi:hypothetical protein